MDRPKTLFALANREPRPPRLGEATLILIDYQNDYLDGPMALTGVEDAIEQAERLLRAMRRAGEASSMSPIRASPAACSIVRRRAARSSPRWCPSPARRSWRSRAQRVSGTELAALAGPPGAALIFAGS